MWHTVPYWGNRTARLAYHLAGGCALEVGLENASSDRTHSTYKDMDFEYPLAARIPRHRHRQNWGT